MFGFPDLEMHIINNVWFSGSRDAYYKIYTPWIMLVFMSLVPFILLKIGNSMIIYKIFIYKRARNRMSGENNSHDSQSMMAMLISISLLYVITQTPSMIIVIFKETFKNASDTLEYKYTYNIIQSLSRYLKWGNHAVNFFCYCISGKKFRNELVSMFKQWFCCSKQTNDVKHSGLATVSSHTQNSQNYTITIPNIGYLVLTGRFSSTFLKYYLPQPRNLYLFHFHNLAILG